MIKRLRLVTPRFGREIVGGAESIARQLGIQLVARGWQVDAWTTTATDEATWRNELNAGASLDEGIRVQRFLVPMRRSPWLFHQFSRGFFRLPLAVRPERAWVIAQGPYSPGLVRALATARPVPTLFIPYLFHPTLRGIAHTARPRIMIPAAHDEAPLRLGAVGRAIAAADALWFSTPEERELVVAAHPQSARIPYAVGTVGVCAPATVDGDRFRADHHVTGPTLYYGGRVAAGKGFDTLLAGFHQLRQQLPTAQLLLSGEAGSRPVLDDGVVSLGQLSDAERWDALTAATATVVPSRYESLSLLALEAWAVGRPCLLNGQSPVLAGQARRSGGALLFESADELALTAHRLLTEPGLADRLGAAGRDYVAANYTWDAVVARLEQLLLTITA